MLNANAEHPKCAIAVLDCDEHLAQMSAEYLIARGYVAQPFSVMVELVAALGENSYDAFLLNWAHPAGTSEPLINHIRQGLGSMAPIVLLTGSLFAAEDAQTRTRLIDRYNLVILDKPKRLAIVEAVISKGLRQV